MEISPMISNRFVLPQTRKCSVCGKKYFRRNTMEQWTGRNPGRRYGWCKEIVKVCLECQTMSDSSKAIGLVSVQFKKTEVRRAPTHR